MSNDLTKTPKSPVPGAPAQDAASRLKRDMLRTSIDRMFEKRRPRSRPRPASRASCSRSPITRVVLAGATRRGVCDGCSTPRRVPVAC